MERKAYLYEVRRYRLCIKSSRYKYMVLCCGGFDSCGCVARYEASKDEFIGRIPVPYPGDYASEQNTGDYEI